AEAGIRRLHVTGVQTCALPISPPEADRERSSVTSRRPVSPPAKGVDVRAGRSAPLAAGPPRQSARHAIELRPGDAKRRGGVLRRATQSLDRLRVDVEPWPPAALSVRVRPRRRVPVQ